jgi:hypothetical protein
VTSCACFCDTDEQSDVYDARWRVARKAHFCCECCEEIAPGQRYEYASFCYDDSWGHAKTCELCVRIRDDLCGRSFCHGDLRQAIWECLEFDYLTGDEKPPFRPLRSVDNAGKTIEP